MLISHVYSCRISFLKFHILFLSFLQTTVLSMSLLKSILLHECIAIHLFLLINICVIFFSCYNVGYDSKRSCASFFRIYLGVNFESWSIHIFNLQDNSRLLKVMCQFTLLPTVGWELCPAMPHFCLVRPFNVCQCFSQK